MQEHYQRSVDELREVASMFWPPEISERETKISVIPTLIETQDDFIAILNLRVPSLNNLFVVIDQSSISINLFVKHLMVLADVGGEFLQRINSEFSMLFPDKQMQFLFGDTEQTYEFLALPVNGTLSNSRLGVSGKKLFSQQSISDIHRDVIAILIFGSAITDKNTAMILSKCEVGDYIGKKYELEQFVKQRYIWVSRITGGSRSNNMGQLAQKFVQEYMEDELKSSGISIQSNGHLPEVTHTSDNDDRLTTFDIVASKNERYVAIEVSFQVTTNSVIERKAGQAKSRYVQVNNRGYKIAYVLDGAGNFQRETALKTLCVYSDCTVAFSQEEMQLLCQFVSDYLG